MQSYYFNNAATSFPKPKCVTKAITEFVTKGFLNLGRSNEEGTDFISSTRNHISNLLNINQKMKIIKSFCLIKVQIDGRET